MWQGWCGVMTLCRGSCCVRAMWWGVKAVCLGRGVVCGEVGVVGRKAAVPCERDRV